MSKRAEDAAKVVSTATAIISEGEGSADAELADLGYAPQLKRTRGQLATQCLLFSLFAVPFGYTTGFYTGLLGGGAVSILWGFIVVGVMQEFVAISLGELASAFPTAAGPYFWVYQLAPQSIRVPLSYVTGVLYMLAIWMLDLGTHWGTASIIIGCVNIYHPNYVAPVWLTFIINLGLYTFSTLSTYFGNKRMGLVDTLNAAVTFSSILVIFIVLLATHKRGFNSASFVFASYEPQYSGWGEGWTFFIGLLPGCFVMCGVGMVAAMSEEVQHPEIQIPRSMVIGIPVATISGVLLALAMLFTAPPVEELLGAPGGLPVPYILKVVTGSRVGGLLLFLTILSAAVAACIANQFAASRTTWAFARDHALPYSRFFARVDERAQPLNALLLCTVVQVLFSLIAFGSTSAINAFLGVGIIGAELSYGIPVTTNLFTGRVFIAKAPFHAGKLGFVANCIAVVWMCLCLVIFCMPTQIPVSLASMNWASVVLVGFMTFAAVWYLVAARRTYRGPPASAALYRHEADERRREAAKSDSDLPTTEA